MAEVQGTVQRINDRIVSTRNGDVPAYSMQVLTNGEPTWYGLGFTKPGFREGSFVEFEATQNAKGYWDVDGKVRVLKSEQPAASNTGGGSQALSNRDKSITLQTAFKVAPMIVDSMVKADILSFPKTKKEASQDALMETTTRIAYDLQKMFLEPDKFDPTNNEAEGEEEEYGQFED